MSAFCTWCGRLKAAAFILTAIFIGPAWSASHHPQLVKPESFVRQLPPGSRILLSRERLRKALHRNSARGHSAASIARFKKVAESAAAANSLPVDFFLRLIKQESGFDPDAVSPVGAQGIAQFMPSTGAEQGLKDPFDPDEALPKSAALLKELKDQFGNWGLAAAAYNAGPRRVQQWLDGQARLPTETVRYVQAITGRDIGDWAHAGTALLKVRAKPETAQLIRKHLRRKPTAGNWELTLLHSLAAAEAKKAGADAGSNKEQVKSTSLLHGMAKLRRSPRIAEEQDLCASCALLKIY